MNMNLLTIVTILKDKVIAIVEWCCLKIRAVIPSPTLAVLQPQYTPVRPAIAKGDTVLGYLLVGRLGAGTYGEVFRSSKVRSGDFVAVKLRTPGETRKKEANRRALFRSGSKILKSLTHPNLIAWIDYRQDPTIAILVVELAETDLSSYIDRKRQEDGELTEEAAKPLFYQLVRAVQHCHHNNIIHRDIKPDNVLLMNSNSPNPHVKLADFGVACRNKHGKFEDFAGTRQYMAPQVIELLENGRNRYNRYRSKFFRISLPQLYYASGRFYGFDADIWSCGVVLNQLLVGWLPFHITRGPLASDGIDDILDDMVSFEPNQQLSSEAQALLKEMLEYEP